MIEILGGAAGGAAIWHLVVWILKRDRVRVGQDIRDLWDEMNKIKAEQASLREKVAGLPSREDLQRMEAKLEKKIDELTKLVLEAMRSRS